MFLSMNWIRDFVNLDGIDLDNLVHQFTLGTAEVEGIEHIIKDLHTKVRHAYLIQIRKTHDKSYKPPGVLVYGIQFMTYISCRFLNRQKYIFR